MKRIVLIAFLWLLFCSLVSCSVSQDEINAIYDVTPKLYQMEYDLQRTNYISAPAMPDPIVRTDAEKTINVEYIGKPYVLEYYNSIGDTDYYRFDVDENTSLIARVKNGTIFDIGANRKDIFQPISKELLLHIDENSSADAVIKKVEEALPALNIKSYEKRSAEILSEGEYRLYFYNEYENLRTKYLCLELSTDGNINILTNYDSLSIYRRIDDSCKLDFKINAKKRDTLIDAKLSEMYNTKQMSYKDFEIERELGDSGIEGSVFMYNNELYVFYNLDVCFTVNNADYESSEGNNCCMLLIPLRLIEK